MAHHSKSFLFFTILAFVFCLAFLSDKVTPLQISVFPHFQTFDSWDNCSYTGTCYELYCQKLKGGWVNPEFHDNAPPYTEEVRSWWVNQGPTTSGIDANQVTLPCNRLRTGPCYDHTSSGGKYMYAESSGCFGYLFRATTPTFIFTAANASVEFYYYMYGTDLNTNNKHGHLRLKMSLSNGTNWVTLVDVDGQQQTNSTAPWKYSFTSLDSFFPSPATPTAPVLADFMFEALTGGDRSADYWRGDIAIDDIYWTQAGAPDTRDPYIDPVTDNTGTTDGGGDGISDGEIAGIVVGVVGGLGALCCCLLLLLLLLLLAISPRGPAKKGAAPADGDGL